MVSQGAQQRRAERLAMRSAMAATHLTRPSLDGSSPAVMEAIEAAVRQQQQQHQQQAGDTALEPVQEGGMGRQPG